MRLSRQQAKWRCKHLTAEGNVADTQYSTHLQCICCYLICQTDASPLLLKVDDQAGAVLLDVAHGHLELPRAVALQRPEHLCNACSMSGRRASAQDCGMETRVEPALSPQSHSTEHKISGEARLYGSPDVKQASCTRTGTCNGMACSRRDREAFIIHQTGAHMMGSCRYLCIQRRKCKMRTFSKPSG